MSEKEKLSKWQQLYILLWRNILIFWKSTFICFIFPVGFTCLLILMRLLLKEDIHPPNQDTPEQEIYKLDEFLKPEDKFLFYAPTNDPIVDQIVDNLKLQANVYADKIIGLSDEVTLKEAINSNASVDFSTHAFGLYFDQVDDFTQWVAQIIVDGRFLPKAPLMGVDPNRIWQENTDNFELTQPIVAIQNALLHSSLSVVSGLNHTEIDLNIKLKAMPLREYTVDYYKTSFEAQAGFFSVIGFAIVATIMSSYLWIEKEENTRELMLIHGLNPFIYQIGWIIIFLLMFLIDSIALSALLSDTGYNAIPTNFFTYFIILFLFGSWSVMIVHLVTCFSFLRNKQPLLLMFFFFWTFNINIDHNTSSTTTYLLSLLPPVAFDQAIMTTLLHRNATTSGLILMLLLDVALTYLAFIYFEKVIPDVHGLTQPWYFIFQKSYWCKTVISKVDTFPDVLNEDDEKVKLPEEKKNIVISEIQKNFTSGKTITKALDHLNISIYEDQVTALLGHNGAGKSTLIKVLTGLIPSTKGKIIFEGLHIEDAIDDIRQNLGFCPQSDSLTPGISVIEHIRFFAALKGVPSKDIEREVNHFLKEMNLMDRKDMNAIKLSGGEKRKLHIAIALIGGPKFIILDEPSSGMDPSSRNYFWETLRKMRQGRVILIATHFMDEADVIGDRVAILSRGKLRCAGTSLFLRNRFGVNYKLTVNLKPGTNYSDIEKLTSFIHSYIDDSKLITHSLEDQNKDNIYSDSTSSAIYSLSMDSITKYADLFDNLEEKKSELKIEGYGIELTTLEQVFLNLATEEALAKESESLANESENTKVIDKEKQIVSTADIESGDKLPNLLNKTTTPNLVQQFKATILKRFILTYRFGPSYFMTLIMPLFFFLFPIFLWGDQMNIDELEMTITPPSADFSIINTDYFNHDFPWTSPTSQYNLSDDFTTYIWDEYTDGTTSYLSSYQELVSHLLDKTVPESISAMSINDIYMNNTSFLLNATLMTNYSYHQSNPYLFSSLARGVFDSVNYTGKGLSISMIPLPYKIMGMEFFLTILMKFHNVVISFFFFLMGFAFFFVGSNSTLVKERESMSMELQYCTGMRVSAYWLANIVFDFFMFLILFFIFYILLFSITNIPGITDRSSLPLFIIFFFYFWSTLMISYIIARFIKTYQGFARAFILYSLLATFPFFTNTILKGVGYEEETDKLLFLFVLFPPSACIMATFRLYYDVVEKMAFELDRDSLVWDWDKGISEIIVVLFLVSVFFTLLLIVLENKLLAKVRFFKTNVKTPKEEETDEVISERDRIIKSWDDKNSDPISTLRLRKVYPSKKNNEPVQAVKDVSFGIRTGACMGIIGPNGSGKSTLLNMLTGLLLPTDGNAKINELDIKKTNVNTLKSNLSIMPQNIALLDNLTGKEHIELYSRIRGYCEEDIQEIVKTIDQTLNLGSIMFKRAKELSGGNQKRLAAAIVIASVYKILMLDEPSTGIDPQNRRKLWDTIVKIRPGRATLLTSHVMEEVETNCNKIGILISGKLTCIGNSQFLKKKYGSGYRILIQLNHDQKDGKELKEFVFNLLGSSSKLTENVAGTYKFFLPESELKLGKFFREMEMSKERLSIDYYSIIQPTLEQVFIDMEKKTIRTND